jgi:hypothetical protein
MICVKYRGKNTGPQCVKIKFGFIIILMAEAVAYVVEKIICYLTFVK